MLVYFSILQYDVSINNVSIFQYTSIQVNKRFHINHCSFFCSQLRTKNIVITFSYVTCSFVLTCKISRITLKTYIMRISVRRNSFKVHQWEEGKS